MTARDCGGSLLGLIDHLVQYLLQSPTPLQLLLKYFTYQAKDWSNWIGGRPTGLSFLSGTADLRPRLLESDRFAVAELPYSSTHSRPAFFFTRLQDPPSSEDVYM